MKTLIICCVLLNPMGNEQFQPPKDYNYYFLQKSIHKIIVIEDKEIKTIPLRQYYYGKGK
jgi:hypothetical protein